MRQESPLPELTTEPITAALTALRGGHDEGLDALFTAVYPELRRMARRQMASEPRTLTPTALVHELYLKLSASMAVNARDRCHFLAVCARAMRQILIDGARRSRAAKRQALPLLDTSAEDAGLAADLIALDVALTRLQQDNERLGTTVELRFFGGLSVEETAEVMGVSARTVKRDWRVARAFLHRALTHGTTG